MRNRSVDVHQFAMVPRADIPRSSFRIQTTHKTTFDAGYLIPVYVDEVLPGDSFSVRMSAFARLSTPLFPVMDNLHLDSFFFFVPCRLVWQNWKKFMGEQDNPTDSVDYLVPRVTSPVGGWPIGSLGDHFGLPTEGQVAAGATVASNAMPLRAYKLIMHEWFRDENLQNAVVVRKDDGPDPANEYALIRRGKRHDYFTSALPWPQKGSSVPLPIAGIAQVIPDPAGAVNGYIHPTFISGGNTEKALNFPASGNQALWGSPGLVAEPAAWKDPNLVADLTTATMSTVNQLRQGFQIQKLLERDARGGTRYTEIVRAHFGVVSPDARLQRPEFLGGGSSVVTVNPIAQTSATGIQGSTTPQGTLGAMATTSFSGHGFSQSFTEHGYVIGMVSVRADLTYQQGLRRMWSRRTRYDFYFPVFAALGEQTILNKEIYCKGDANDDLVFGYQERWAEYRYNPAMITGKFRSTAAATLDPWHLAQHFTSLPTLNAQFIEDTPPLERVLAVGAAAAGEQFIFDSFFDIRAARPMPMYSVPGMIDHF